jgi:hypothetical protein
MLYDIIEQGIEKKAAYAELGQTAEEPKLRTGGTVTSRYMAAHHSSIIFRSVLNLAKGLLEYRGKFSQHHVFKGEMDNDADMR